MKQNIQIGISFGIALCILTINHPLQAQIIPDATLSNNSRVTNQGNTNTITGGTRAGSNLFHSFSQFSVPTNGVAHFDNALDIQNIISRVTGGSASNIDGLIRANGIANLFLINPNGIIFGPNARLNIGGSFLGSTASSLKFADGTTFSATAPQTTPLLTISVPIGLQFEPTAGEIRVQGVGAVRDTDSGLLLNREAGLRVQPDQTLALVGSNVVLEGGILTTDGGRIELGSVAGSSLVSLTPINKGWALGYSGAQTFEDIQLSQQAAVDASGKGGGDIYVRGRRLTLQDGSQIESSTLGAAAGGTLAVLTSDLVDLSSPSADGQFSSSLASIVYPGATGTGGNLTIATGKLIVSSGAQVIAGTAGQGNAGNVLVNASDSVELSGAKKSDPSSLLTQAIPGSTGSAGDLTINTGKLMVSNGAAVSSETLGPGKAGNLSVAASESVNLLGGDPANGPTSLSTSSHSSGGVGDLRISTRNLLIQNGAQVSADTSDRGNGGNIQVDATSSVNISGVNSSGYSSGLFAGTVGIGQGSNITVNSSTLRVADGGVVTTSTRGPGNGGNITINANAFEADNGGQIRADTTKSGSAGNIKFNVSNNITFSNSDRTFTAQLAQFGKDVFVNNGSVVSGVFANTAPGSTGNGGQISIDPTNLTLTSGAIIAVNSLGAGKAGDLNIQAGTVSLDRGSSITAATTSGENGNIGISSRDLRLQRGSYIDASALSGTRQGGNVTFNTGTLVMLDSSRVKADAYGGPGGNISINAQGIFRSPDSAFSASSRFGISGTVRLNTLDVNRSLEVAVLPVVPVDYTKLIAPGCSANGPRGSKFVVTGSGGLPPSPSDTVSSDNSTIEDWGTVQGKDSRASTVVSSNLNDSDPDGIVKATGWVTDSKGHVVSLVANAPTYTPDVPWLKPPSCHAQ